MADPSVRFSQVKKFLGNSLKVCAARGEHSSQIKLIGEKGKDEVILLLILSFLSKLI